MCFLPRPDCEFMGTRYMLLGCLNTDTDMSGFGHKDANGKLACIGSVRLSLLTSSKL